MSDASVSNNSEVGLAAPMPEIEWAAIRTRRDQLLQATDFTQLPDFPISADQLAQVTAYRKALRDIPQAIEQPSQVLWPEKPSFIS
ncbi:tail fiber assembly protein [Pseudomonas ekonensis]|nr:tail fiber assembly protein [Pseudomonas ekonensis]